MRYAAYSMQSIIFQCAVYIRYVYCTVIIYATTNSLLRCAQVNERLIVRFKPFLLSFFKETKIVFVISFLSQIRDCAQKNVCHHRRPIPSCLTQYGDATNIGISSQRIRSNCMWWYGSCTKGYKVCLNTSGPYYIHTKAYPWMQGQIIAIYDIILAVDNIIRLYFHCAIKRTTSGITAFISDTYLVVYHY